MNENSIHLLINAANDTNDVSFSSSCVQSCNNNFVNNNNSNNLYNSTTCVPSYVDQSNNNNNSATFSLCSKSNDDSNSVCLNFVDSQTIISNEEPQDQQNPYQPHHATQFSNLYTQLPQLSSFSSPSVISLPSLPPLSSTSSISSTATHSGSGYSELLRYRSQEFYTKLVYSTTNNNCATTAITTITTTTTTSPPPPTDKSNTFKESQFDYNHHKHSNTRFNNNNSLKNYIQLARYNSPNPHAPRLHALTNTLYNKELSLNDLSQANLYASFDYSKSSGIVCHEVSNNQKLINSQQLLQTRLGPTETVTAHTYIPHHPHYKNHLYSAGAISGNSNFNSSGSSSLVRSNSSLSLGYHQQLQYQQKYCRLWSGHHHHNHHPNNDHQFMLPSTNNLAIQQHNNPTATLSTHNLFTDSGYCSAYSGSIGSGTLDSRGSKLSSHSSSNHHHYKPLSSSALINNSSYQHRQHSDSYQKYHHQKQHNGKNNIQAKGQIPSYIKSIESSPISISSSTSYRTSNYYSSSPALSISTPSSPQNSSFNLIFSSSCSSTGHNDTITSPAITTFVTTTINSLTRSDGTSRGGQAPLIRSTSSGPSSIRVVTEDNCTRLTEANGSLSSSSYIWLNSSFFNDSHSVLVNATGGGGDKTAANNSMHFNQHSSSSSQQQQYSHYACTTSSSIGNSTQSDSYYQKPIYSCKNAKPYSSSSTCSVSISQQQSTYSNKLSNRALPNNNNNNIYGLPQRFPTTTSSNNNQYQTSQTCPSMVKLVSDCEIISGPQKTNQLSNTNIMSSSQQQLHNDSDGKIIMSSSDGENPNSLQQQYQSNNFSTSFAKSLFNPTNIFESKKNKLFGSVSSIDLQVSVSLFFILFAICVIVE